MIVYTYDGKGWVERPVHRWDGAGWATTLAKTVRAVPYSFPAAAPWNVPKMPLPTPDGSGQTVHPDVLDFRALGPGTWNGWRYWMGVTPFPAGDPAQENPCILVSDNGYHWEVPLGLTNPIAPQPAAPFTANSDTDLLWDPATNELVLTWRAYSGDSERIELSRSKDGSTWAPPAVIMSSDGSAAGNGGGNQQITSQAIVRVTSTDWRMFTINADQDNVAAKPDRMWTATKPEGPWGNPQPIVYGGTGHNSYHADVVLGPDGRFWMTGQHFGAIFASVSVDGVNWVSGKKFLLGRAGEWDATQYRASIVAPSTTGDVDVWYSAFSDDGVVVGYSSQKWWSGYTRVPASLWSGIVT